MRRFALASVVLLFVIACTSGTGSATESGTGAAAAPASRNPNRITDAEFTAAALGDRTLYDAIAQLRPNWLRSRGATSFRDGGAGNVPVVMVDNVRQNGAMTDNLRMVKIQDTLEVQFLSASEATTMYGTGFPNGLIKVTTRRGR